ncbi:MAG: RIP metalloprotease RseP [Chromatiales bacterium]|nr:MAG: RIP metalloprotease RseP [Chromatiales bacterium]
MSGFLTSLLSFLVAIAVLVAVHEWGHYIVARLAGVKVLRFSIGFGKPLWLRRGGPDQTEYCLSAIPIGGYVRLLDERDGTVGEAERDRAFNRQSVPARVAILFAGPGMNFLFAILAYWVMFGLGVPGLKPVIGEVEPRSIAATAGIRAEDVIVSVGDRPVATWEGTVIAMLDDMLANGDIRMRVEGADGGQRGVRLATGGREAELTEPGQLYKVIGLEPWRPTLDPVIDEVTPGGTAESSGLLSGDLILSAEGEAFADWSAWVEFVKARPGQVVDVTLRRDGSILELPLEIGVLEADGERIGRIGAGPRVPDDLYEGRRALQRYGFFEGAAAAVTKTWDMSALTVRMILRMITGDVSVKNISGPINIAQFAGYSVSGGLTTFLGFLAIVSVSLGILNLLPVPMLDGGQILYQLAEAVKGSPLSEQTQVIGQQVGILFLLILMSFAFYNDLSRLFG